MASTTNNSGLEGDASDEYGPDEKWDDESDEQYRQRMEKKKKWEVTKAEYEKNKMPPCIG